MDDGNGGCVYCGVASTCDVVLGGALDEELPVCDDLLFCDSDDGLLVPTAESSIGCNAGTPVVQRRSKQKSAAAQHQQDAATAKFDAHRRRMQASQMINAAHVKTLETPHTLLRPNEHLTKAYCELATLVHASTITSTIPCTKTELKLLDCQFVTSKPTCRLFAAGMPSVRLLPRRNAWQRRRSAR